MRKLSLVVATFLIGGAVGVVVNDLASRMRREKGVQTVVRMMNETVIGGEESARTMLALESVVLAETLRNNDIDGALQLLEGRVESARRALQEPFPESSEVSQRRAREVLARIGEYQGRFPWTPRPPTEEEVQFLNQVGRLNPVFSGDGLLGMRIGTVRPGSIFDQMGLRVGDLIVEFNETPMRDVPLERFWETLEANIEFEVLVVSDGVERTARYTPPE
jgi:hypothetical protein